MVIAQGGRVGVSINWLRDVVCGALRVVPDESNWSAPNITAEVYDLIRGCPWHRAYDVMETIHDALRDRVGGQSAPNFEAELNSYMRENGIGWEMRKGRFEARGTAAQEEAVQSAEVRLQGSGLVTAASLLRAARQKLSQRPNADTRNAVNDAMGALEAVTRQLAGNSKSTFGELIKANPQLFPAALKKVAEGGWGYASEVTRHGQEGQVTTVADALLVVGIAAAFCEYLVENSPPTS